VRYGTYLRIGLSSFSTPQKKSFSRREICSSGDSPSSSEVILRFVSHCHSDERSRWARSKSISDGCLLRGWDPSREILKRSERSGTERFLRRQLKNQRAIHSRSTLHSVPSRSQQTSQDIREKGRERDDNFDSSRSRPSSLHCSALDKNFSRLAYKRTQPPSKRAKSLPVLPRAVLNQLIHSLSMNSEQIKSPPIPRTIAPVDES
jgi:hypothetical protein